MALNEEGEYSVDLAEYSPSSFSAIACIPAMRLIVRATLPAPVMSRQSPP